MHALRNDAVAQSTAALFAEIAAELRADGIEIKIIGGDDGSHVMSLEAWYQSNPGRSAVITCERRMIAVDQLDCLVTTIRERLRATPGRMRTRMTWDHTGTLWPD